MVKPYESCKEPIDEPILLLTITDCTGRKYRFSGESGEADKLWKECSPHVGEKHLVHISGETGRNGRNR